MTKNVKWCWCFKFFYLDQPLLNVSLKRFISDFSGGLRDKWAKFWQLSTQKWQMSDQCYQYKISFSCTWAKGSSALLLTGVVCHPSGIIFSHFQFLFWNRLMDFDKTRQELASTPNTGLWLAETFSTSPLKLLNGIQWNFTENSTSSTKLVFLGLIG